MGLHAVKLPQASAVPPYWCTILLLACSLLSSSQAKSCRRRSSGSTSDLDSIKYTFNSTFDKLPGFMSFNSNVTILPAGLGYYKKHLPSKLNLSEPGLFIINNDSWILWDTSSNGTIQEASFNVVFTMSIYQPMNQDTSVNGSLIFAILPSDYNLLYSNDSLATPFSDSFRIHEDNPIVKFEAPNQQFTIWACDLFDQYQTILNDSATIYVKIDMEPSGSTNTRNYSFSIQYNPHGHSMKVQVDVDEEGGQTSSGSTHSSIYLSNMSSQSGLFSFSSSMGQLFQLHTWNLTIELPPDEWEIPQKNKDTTAIILSSVLGSAAVTVATAAVVYCYFNSKYMGWKKELDQLAKIMQLLPGVPTQFSFSEIRRATNNFHETTKLGRGGFGAVYRCRLPAPKKGEALEVAVKKFSRDDNRRYEDFLAEVSVINRLRHKNIVPLVGWSYNKGEPLLIYEYMPNGSLDQHLFRRSSGEQQQQNPINRWDTRYNIVKDIATGLHYVHHEYEPRVLHRDIKASNVMIDSSFQGRLGDFGLACVVTEGKNSYTDIGTPGTIGFMAPEYTHSGKATTKSDIFAFGVLVLEIVTGKVAVNAQYCHITDGVWRLHKEGRLLDAVDPLLTTEFHASDAKRLLLLGLACSHPNASDRPTMVEAMQVITKSAPPPEVPPEKPRFVWPLEDGHSLSSDYSTELSSVDGNLTIGIEMTEGRQASSSENGRNSLHHRPIPGPSQEVFSIYHTAE